MNNDETDDDVVIGDHLMAVNEATALPSAQELAHGSPQLQSSEITDFDSLVDAVIKEQFLQSLNPNVRAFVASKEPKTAHDTAIAADLCFSVNKIKRETNFRNRGAQGGQSNVLSRFAGQGQRWPLARPAVVRSAAPSSAPYRPSNYDHGFRTRTPTNGASTQRSKGNFHGGNMRLNFGRNTYPSMFARNDYVCCDNYLDSRYRGMNVDVSDNCTTSVWKKVKTQDSLFRCLLTGNVASDYVILDALLSC